MLSRTLSAVSISLAAGLLLAPAPADASDDYPDEMLTELELDSLPGPGDGCQLCHTNDDGGLNSITKPFGITMQNAGTIGASARSLREALATVEAEGYDSDLDGVGDIAELRAGTDPNFAPGEEPAEDLPVPRTGCSFAPATGASRALSGLGALFLLVVTRRRRRP